MFFFRKNGEEIPGDQINSWRAHCHPSTIVLGFWGAHPETITTHNNKRNALPRNRLQFELAKREWHGIRGIAQRSIDSQRKSFLGKGIAAI